MKLKLHRGDIILAAWVEYVSGPGGGNKILNVLIESRTKALRLECVQDVDFSGALHALSRVSEAMNTAMVQEVKVSTRRRGSG